MSSAVPQDRESGNCQPVRDSADGVRSAFDSVAERAYITSRADQDALRGSVCQLVHDRKGAGVSVEALIIELRGIADRAGAGGFGARALEDAVRWCISEYYRVDRAD